MRPDAPGTLPRGIRPDFEILLLRTLRALPDPLLAALLVGLERHGDELMPGRLYRSTSSGGCAVGMMVRELHPEAFEIGGLRFWLRHGWRRSARGYGGILAECPRVRHLEYLFDHSVDAVQTAAPAAGAARAAESVGRWMRAHAEAELGRRHDGPHAAVPALPTREPGELADVVC
jgi:hypothetical protein